MSQHSPEVRMESTILTTLQRFVTDYLSLCAVNVALDAHSLTSNDVYALKHLRIELNIDTILSLRAGFNSDTTTDLIAGLETFLTRDHLPHLQTLQIGVRYRVPLSGPFRYPAPSVAFLDQLEAIQVVVRETSAALGEIPLAYTQTVTPILFTLTKTYPSRIPPEVVPHMEYVQIDQAVADDPFRLFPVMSLPHLKAIFVPHGFSFSVDPDAEDDVRELFADFARRKVEFVYGAPPVEWTLIDPEFQAYLRRKKSSP